MMEDATLIQQASDGINGSCSSNMHTNERTFSFCCIAIVAGMLRKIRGWATNESAENWPISMRRFAVQPGVFRHVVGDTAILQQVEYVITLDTDTQLPRDSAREMIAAMAHPLNRPVLDASGQRVIHGYTILQPRVGVSLPSAYRSWFVRLLGGDPGVDPYTRVVSDVYQDLFSEGSFIGKGIYDVDTFDRRCGDFPENRILSHDLLESCYCRSALLTDVVCMKIILPVIRRTLADDIAGCAVTGRLQPG
jgi:hypothetical protein